MFNCPEGDSGPNPIDPQPPKATNSRILDAPSSFVVRVIDELRACGFETHNRLVQALEQCSVFTPREFASFVEKHPQPGINSALLRVYGRIYRDCPPCEIAQGLPALIQLTHHTLIGNHRRNDQKLNRLIGKR